VKRDERGLPLSTESAVAVGLFDRAVEHYLKYHIDTMSLVDDAIAADPQFAMARCLQGYLLLSAANPNHRPKIASVLLAAEENASRATERERQHVAAFAAWASGALDRSFAIWRQILEVTPTDLLALRICDTTWFRHGQTGQIREQADRIAPHWSPDLPGYDLMQCVWAFAHEETGDYAAAERAVDTALERDATNYFAHHVKAHVMEMDGRPRGGCEWLQSQIPNWSAGNNLIHHLWWHRTLMELDLGERETVLASYDTNIRNFADPMTRAVPDHYVDLQNATALLWRLELLGVDVGDRWGELADKAEARTGDAGHLLLVPHLALALAATGRAAATARFLAALAELAADRKLWTARAIADVVIPCCEAAIAHRRAEHAHVVALLEPRREQIRLLGGSNAQRDLFFQMLIDSAMKAECRSVVAASITHETATRSVPPTRRAGYAGAARWLHS
jgi:tetratricopeptide (TPR) repeat protein